MCLLAANQIIKEYSCAGDENKVHALRGISVTVNKGDFIGIMGPSGSGKTTLLNIFGGIDKPTSGTVELEGRVISSLDKDETAILRREKFGFVMQDFNLLDSLTVIENIALPLILQKKPPREIEKKCREIMSLLDITRLQNKYPFQISGGEKQRTAIGRALANSPLILFADEPTGNLDSEASHTLMTYFQKLNEEKECTILLVTHDPIAASYCKKILYLTDGAIHGELLNPNDKEAFLNTILNKVAAVGGIHR